MDALALVLVVIGFIILLFYYFMAFSLSFLRLENRQRGA